MTLSANKFFIDILDKAQSDKINFTEKLEAAKGDDIFKYILLQYFAKKPP